MEALLDHNNTDPALIDKVVAAAYAGSGAEQKRAMAVLTEFQALPDSWQKVPVILEGSASQQAKYIGLQIMEKLIMTRWKVLPEAQRSGIKNFIVNYVLKVGGDENMNRTQKGYMNKVNLVLVQILKQEWPHNWPTFITEIVASSRTSVALCENNMNILRTLSEEIFDYSAEQMTQAKTTALKNQMCNEFSDVFQLCNEVLAKAQKPSLIGATLACLLRFLNWIPLGFIFETNLIDHLVNRYLEERQHRNITLRCLAEIGSIRDAGPEYNQKFVMLLNAVMIPVNRILPPETDLKSIWENQPQYEQEFIMALAVFLSSYLTKNAKLLENTESEALAINAHMYLLKICTVDDRETFKVCLEYWAKFVKELYDEQQSQPLSDMGPLMGLNLGSPAGAGAFGAAFGASTESARKKMYLTVLMELRKTFVEKMVKPEEVLVVENDEGEVVREFLKETDTIILYKQMREVLVYLTHLDVSNTENIMLEKLSHQVDGTEWSWHNCNTLCWAIGSVSGAMTEEQEKRFLVTVIKDLLGLTEQKRGKDNKAIVASDIMYIVGQYPRFLKAHWKFLKTVVNKLFEFMHETHEGVQDMACDTFIKIAQKCRRHFIIHQSGESEPFVDEIIRSLPAIVSDLQQQQIHTFFEAVGYMIAAQPNRPIQENLIGGLMAPPNKIWDDIMELSKQNLDVLANPETVRSLAHALKCNVSACTSIGSFFGPQLARIYLDMLGVYRGVSEIISNTVAQDGLIATKTPRIRGLRTIKKEILKLVETHIRRAEDLNNLKVSMLPPLLEAMLGDYNKNIPAARDAEVLNVVTTIVSRLGSLVNDQISPILESVFEPTLTMISGDFSEFPEHRLGFYKLLRVIDLHCFDALLELGGPRFMVMMESLQWAASHTTRDISDLGVIIQTEIIQNITDSPRDTANAFFQQFYLNLLRNCLSVLTDQDHKSGFKSQSSLLMRLWSIIQNGHVTAPLFNPAEHDASMTNVQFIKEFTYDSLTKAFPHVQAVTTQQFITGCSDSSTDQVRFKNNLRDYLISLREWAGTGDTQHADLFQEDKEAAAAAKAQEQAAVPGMVKPSDIRDEDEEII